MKIKSLSMKRRPGDKMTDEIKESENERESMGMVEKKTVRRWDEEMSDT